MLMTTVQVMRAPEMEQPPCLQCFVRQPLPFSLSFSLYLRFYVSLSLSVNEAFVFVHASKLIKEFNTVNLLRLVETLRMKALKIDSGCAAVITAVGFH